MTNTNTKRAQMYIKKRKTAFLNRFAIKEKHLLLLCVLSLFTVGKNMFFACLPLVILQLCTERQTMYLCAVTAEIYYISTFLRTPFYVPCAAFILVYITADYMLQGREKAVWFAAAVFCISKLYALSFGYSSVYYAVLAGETAALVLLPEMVRGGFEFIGTARETLSPSQLADIVAAFLLAALSLQGLSLRQMDFAVCFLMAAVFFYTVRESMPMTLAAFLSASVILCTDKNFGYLFAGYAVIAAAGCLLLKGGTKGYMSVTAAAAAVTAVFISKFNSFVFLSTTATALVLCFAADRFKSVSVTVPKEERPFTQDYMLLSEKIEKLNRCFNFLGNTVTDISKLLVKDGIPDDLAQMVENQICRSCKSNHICWQQNYSHTQSQFANYAHDIQKGKNAAFDSLFLSQCDKSEKLSQAFAQNNRLLSAQRLVYQAGVHNQKLLQSQFLTMAQVLKDITYHNSRSGIVNTAVTHTMGNYIDMLGKRADYCVCYQNRAKCVIGTRDIFDEDTARRIRIKLENLYGTKFADGEKQATEEGCVYTFCEVPMFRAEYGTYSKGRFAVCGDVSSFFTAEGMSYAVLADGMGTGSFAAAEAQTAVIMLKNLLVSGVQPQVAIEITNTAINLKGTGQSCVALDILMVDCYSGKTVLYKAGGAPTVVLDSERIKTLSRESLPIGILKETKTATSEFVLNNGDSVILASDGADISKEKLFKARLMAQKLEPEKMAQLMLQDSDGSDDATVSVIKLIRI